MPLLTSVGAVVCFMSVSAPVPKFSSVDLDYTPKTFNEYANNNDYFVDFDDDMFYNDFVDLYSYFDLNYSKPENVLDSVAEQPKDMTRLKSLKLQAELQSGEVFTIFDAPDVFLSVSYLSGVLAKMNASHGLKTPV